MTIQKRVLQFLYIILNWYRCWTAEEIAIINSIFLKIELDVIEYETKNNEIIAKLKNESQKAKPDQKQINLFEQELDKNAIEEIQLKWLIDIEMNQIKCILWEVLEDWYNSNWEYKYIEWRRLVWYMNDLINIFWILIIK